MSINDGKVTKYPTGVENFGERLRIVINGEPTGTFSRRCGISNETIKKYLKNDTCPGIDKALAISQCTGVSLHWLISGEGERNDSPFSDDEINRWWGIMAEALTVEQKAQIISVFQRNGVEGVFKPLSTDNRAWDKR